MTPYKKFLAGMVGVAGGVCLGAGIGLGIYTLISIGLISIVCSIVLLFYIPEIPNQQNYEYRYIV